MFSFLNREPPLDQPSIDWLFATFTWALDNLGGDHFFDETRLILPNNDFFPGRIDSIDAMAKLIFEQVRGYAGMSHWPFQLIDGRRCGVPASVPMPLTVPLRRVAAAPAEAASADPVALAYDPAQIAHPEVAIANFAQLLAHYLATQAAEPPPDSEVNWYPMTEVVGVFMGFGLMFCNTAYQFRGGCGGCGGASAGRDNALSERDITYALAIFSVLKDIPRKRVTAHLKPHLRRYFGRAVSDISERQPALSRMRGSAEAC